MQCVKLGPGDAKEVTPDTFDTSKQDIKCARVSLPRRGPSRSRRSHRVPLLAPCVGQAACLHASLHPPPLPRRQTKLRVVLVGPPKPPSPVPEGIEEATSPSIHDGPAAPSSGATLRDQLGAAQEEKAEIRKRLDLLEDRSTTVAGGRGGAAQQVGRERQDSGGSCWGAASWFAPADQKPAVLPRPGKIHGGLAASSGTIPPCCSSCKLSARPSPPLCSPFRRPAASAGSTSC